MAEVIDGLRRVMARVSAGEPGALHRLTGGATMESWRFDHGGARYVLRRAPSLAFMEGRTFGHDAEAAIIRAARDAGVTAPEVVTVLEPGDGIGSGFVMRALPGTADPRVIQAMDTPAAIVAQAARDLARIHALRRADLPADVPELDYAEGVAALRLQFEEAGGDRPIIALGLRWLMDNLPERVEPVLNHGDFRLGNLLCEDSQLTGVLDWELAHFGDPHEDLAFGCMAVWRFARYDRPALGLGSLEEYVAAYEAESGRRVDPARFRFWSVYRTVWWALGCLRQAQVWRSGQDRMLERVVISRRTSENELDLLMLLEEDVPEAERGKKVEAGEWLTGGEGEADTAEIATAVSEWLATVKDRMEGHDRFQLAVARNALGIIARADYGMNALGFDRDEAAQILSGRLTIGKRGYLDVSRRSALRKCMIDSPKYPALAAARSKWIGED